MAASDNNGVRRVVPRWRSYQEVLASGELDPAIPVATKSIDGSDFILEREQLWDAERSDVHAADLLCAAIVLGQSKYPKAVTAAEQILSSSGKVSHAVSQMASWYLGSKEPPSSLGKTHPQEDIFSQIVALKRQRVTRRKDAFVWLDLARSYMLLGHSRACEKALRIARALAPMDRYIIRSQVRFLLHTRKADEALSLLRRHPKTRTDPWLVASEIALSSIVDTNPLHIKLGDQMISGGDFLPFHTSELSSALGSFELFCSNNRKANKYFRLAMRNPNDNALAQVIWASKRSGFDALESCTLPEQPIIAEALTINAHNCSKWSDVVSHAAMWADDESFSSRPRLISSGVASSLLGDPVAGEMLASEGLRTNPGHPGLERVMNFEKGLYKG